MKILLLCLILYPQCAFAGVETPTLPEWMQGVINYATSVVAVASVITSITPSKKDNAVLSAIKLILNALALNFGHAKSKD